jgi:transcriptional regulator with XRE-family HTH domain
MGDPSGGAEGRGLPGIRGTGPDPIDVAVGARIRIRRRVLDMSQTKLAEGLGITFQQIQKYERGSNRVSASMLVKIAATLRTSVAALIGEDGSEPADPIVISQLATPGSMELLGAYANIKQGEARNALLAVAMGIAAIATKRKAAP